jgi:hypothetical protein
MLTTFVALLGEEVKRKKRLVVTYMLQVVEKREAEE